MDPNYERDFVNHSVKTPSRNFLADPIRLPFRNIIQHVSSISKKIRTVTDQILMQSGTADVDMSVCPVLVLCSREADKTIYLHFKIHIRFRLYPRKPTQYKESYVSCACIAQCTHHVMHESSVYVQKRKVFHPLGFSFRFINTFKNCSC